MSDDGNGSCDLPPRIEPTSDGCSPKTVGIKKQMNESITISNNSTVDVFIND